MQWTKRKRDRCQTARNAATHLPYRTPCNTGTHTRTHTRTRKTTQAEAKVKPIRGHARAVSQDTKYTHRGNGVCIANSLHQRTHICTYRHEGKDDANDSATERGQLAEETLIAVITSSRVCTKLLHRTHKKTCNAAQRNATPATQAT